MKYSKEEIFSILTEVKDPEVPVLNIVEMGIVRDAVYEGATLRVDITPTYSGCPALKAIEDEILIVLKAKGISDVKVATVYSPPWTTDWMSEETKKKLKDYGISPPGKADELVNFPMTRESPACPFCGSGFWAPTGALEPKRTIASNTAISFLIFPPRCLKAGFII